MYILSDQNNKRLANGGSGSPMLHVNKEVIPCQAGRGSGSDLSGVRFQPA